MLNKLLTISVGTTLASLIKACISKEPNAPTADDSKAGNVYGGGPSLRVPGVADPHASPARYRNRLHSNGPQRQAEDSCHHRQRATDPVVDDDGRGWRAR